MAASNKINLRDLSRIAIFAAIIAALTFPGAIPLGTGVPITLQTLGIMLAGVVLGGVEGEQVAGAGRGAVDGEVGHAFASVGGGTVEGDAHGFGAELFGRDVGAA